MSITIYRPIRTNLVTQRFGESAACAKVRANGQPYSPYQIKSKVGGVCPVGYKEFYPMLGLKGHNGVDMGSWNGEPLYFPVDGNYEWYAKTEVDQDGGIGVDVYSKTPVDFGNGRVMWVKFRFWHLKKVNVYDGQPVRFGQLIGWCDSTGASSGPHLHWAEKEVDEQKNTLNTNNGFAGAIDFSGQYNNTYVLDILHVKEEYMGIIQQLQKLLYALQAYIANYRKV